MRVLRIHCLVILLVSGLMMARQFVKPYFSSCVIDDSILHMSWVQQFARALSEGTWFPRWLPESNGGYGSPVFIFYSPLVYYVSATFIWVADSVVLSMKLVRWLGLCMSGLAMLAYARRLLDGRLALAVALLYLVLPFHALDLSYWTLYAETWAWVWFPMIFLFLRKIMYTSERKIAPLCGFAFCYSGLILTHLVSAYMFSFVIAGYVLVGSCESWKSTRQISEGNDGIVNPQRQPPGPLQRGNLVWNLWMAIVGVVLGIGLSAYFLIPVVYERQFIHLEYSTLLSDYNFRNTFLFFPNLEQMATNPFQARTVALLQWVTGFQVAWVLVSMVLIIRLKTLSVIARREVMFSSGVVTYCLFLMSRPSAWLWDRVPGLPQIQFSTRWLSILTFSACFLIGLSFDSYRSNMVGLGRLLKLAHFSLGVLAAFMTMLIIFGGCFLGRDEERLAERNVYNAPEYNPRSMPNWRQRVIEPQDPPVAALEGDASIAITKWKGEDRSLAVQAVTPAHVKLRLLDYPGWVVKVDGHQTAHSIDPASGAVVASLQAGFHQVSAEFTWTWWRRLGTAISLVSVGAVVGVGLWARRRDKRP